MALLRRAYCASPARSQRRFLASSSSSSSSPSAWPSPSPSPSRLDQLRETLRLEKDLGQQEKQWLRHEEAAEEQ